MLCWVILLSLGALASCTENLKVSVYYEALCPDSVRFFTTQLKPAYPVIGDRISIEFIPYGKATHFKRNGKWAFRCHHGQNECYANQIQACAVHQDVPEKSRVNFLLCLMSSSRYALVNPANIERCANENAMSPTEIFNCMRGDLKDNLLAQHGDRTQAQDPIITFVPTIIFNNAYDPFVQTDAMEDFLGTVCERLPSKPHNCPAKHAETTTGNEYATVTSEEAIKESSLCSAREICVNIVFWCLFIVTCYVTMMFAINSARKVKADDMLDEAAVQEKHHRFHKKVQPRQLYDDSDAEQFMKLFRDS